MLARKTIVRTVLRTAAAALLASCFVLSSSDVVLACPNCKDALAQNDPTSAGIVQGYFFSILFMMSMPFTILAGLCAYFYLLVRRARANPEAAYDTPLVGGLVGAGAEQRSL